MTAAADFFCNFRADLRVMATDLDLLGVLVAKAISSATPLPTTVAPWSVVAAVILGGGVGGNADLLLAPIERELRALSPARPRLAASALGEDAVLRGAVATALEVAQSRLFDPATLLDRKELVV